MNDNIQISDFLNMTFNEALKLLYDTFNRQNSKYVQAGEIVYGITNGSYKIGSKSKVVFELERINRKRSEDESTLTLTIKEQEYSIGYYDRRVQK